MMLIISGDLNVLAGELPKIIIFDYEFGTTINTINLVNGHNDIVVKLGGMTSTHILDDIYMKIGVESGLATSFSFKNVTVKLATRLGINHYYREANY